MIGSFACSALSFMSSRNLAFRVFASGPWQVRQFSEKIGRTSRLKLTLALTLPLGASPPWTVPGRLVNMRAEGTMSHLRMRGDRMDSSGGRG